MKESLCVKLYDLNVVNNSLKNENSMPVNKVKSLEDNLVVCKFDLSNSSSAKLDCILSFQKHLENKC